MRTEEKVIEQTSGNKEDYITLKVTCLYCGFRHEYLVDSEAAEGIEGPEVRCLSCGSRLPLVFRGDDTWSPDRKFPTFMN